MDLSFSDIKKTDIATCLSIMQKNYDETNDSFYSRNLIIDLQDIFVKDNIYKSNCRICLSGNDIVGFGCYKQSKMSFDIYELFWINVKYEYQNK